MSICEKIMNIGNTLEDNLNDRGVDCTFGIGTNEQNIYDMAELITKQNIRGIGDANIQIIPNRPYVTSGETIDVTVRLLDGVGNPLPNKIIRISDGTNSYNGITDKDGIYTLFNQTITTTTTYTVTYGTETASCLVEYCSFVDYAVTNNKNTNWTDYSSRLNISTDENGTLLNKGSNNGYYFVNNSQFIYSDYICEFDMVEVKGQAYWYHQASSSSTQDVINFASYNVNGKHIKMICQDGIMKVYADGNQIGSDISLTTSTPFEMGFRVNTSTTQNRYIKYKNFRIR